METALLSSGAWAQDEFGGVKLGDLRRTKRLVRIAGALAQEPSGTLPQPLGSEAQLHAAYRLLGSQKVRFEVLARDHWERTRGACERQGNYLLIEDTTDLDYTLHWATEGLGRIGNDKRRGFMLHTTLALRLERWNEELEPELNVVGVFGQRLWRRTEPPSGQRQKKWERQQRGRESERWAAALGETNGAPPGTQWILVADREADIMEVFQRCEKGKADWIVRAAWDRALAKEDRHLFAAVAAAPLKGECEVHLRARPGRPARIAICEVRAREVTLRGPVRPGGRLAPQTMKVVCVREKNAPAGEEPLLWVLFTSLPCETLRACLKVIRLYGARWMVEEYHKALKTGTNVEASQLEKAEALEGLIGILVLVAVRLLALKCLARTDPQRPVDPALLGPEVMQVLEKKFGKPAGGWTVRGALRGVARLGGFLGRKGDGEPGWLTLWRGWRRLVVLVEGYLLAEEEM